MRLVDRQAVGRKVAELVLRAEQLYPAPGSGPIKRGWVMRAARKELAPTTADPSAAFGRWFGAAMLRLAIEVAVACLNLIGDPNE